MDRFSQKFAARTNMPISISNLIGLFVEDLWTPWNQKSYQNGRSESSAQEGEGRCCQRTLEYWKLTPVPPD